MTTLETERDNTDILGLGEFSVQGTQQSTLYSGTGVTPR